MPMGRILPSPQPLQRVREVPNTSPLEPPTSAALEGGEPRLFPHVGSAGCPVLSCPSERPVRDRIRRLASDLVSPWSTNGVPAEARGAAGLRSLAAGILARAGGDASLVGYAMVVIVTEHWRRRIEAGAEGRRLLLLPDCPRAAPSPDVGGDRPPRTCGPRCSLKRLWAHARGLGWVVAATPAAVAGIGGLLTGQYDGILGVAKLSHLEKAFAMLPAFALPIAAVPFDPQKASAADAPDCATALAAGALDVDWVVGLLGGGTSAGEPDGWQSALLREAAGLFSPESLRQVAETAGVGRALAWTDGPPAPLDATAVLGADFLGRGGKFLRPFVTLAAHDAVATGLGGGGSSPPSHRASRAAAVAIEVFHKASLIHDDIEDADGRRYGRSTLHEEAGIPTALNTGDALLGLGYRIIATLPGVDPACRSDLVAVLSDAHLRLARGQGAELWWRDAADRSLSVEESLEIYSLKTSPAFEAALAIGVRLAGVAVADAGPIARYARHVGIGFQVLNDLKDWRGDTDNDRAAAGDLLGGRPTLLWALARERVPATELSRLSGLARADAAAGGPTHPGAIVAEARQSFMAADVFSRAASVAERHRVLAQEALAECPIAPLRSVGEFLLDLAIPGGAAERLIG